MLVTHLLVLPLAAWADFKVLRAAGRNVFHQFTPGSLIDSPGGGGRICCRRRVPGAHRTAFRLSRLRGPAAPLGRSELLGCRVEPAVSRRRTGRGDTTSWAV